MTRFESKPRWYDELEGPHDRALGLAAALRFIGDY